MEVSSELLWKASSALLLCFLVARLVSLLLSFSVPHHPDHPEVREKGYKRTATVDLDHDHKKHIKIPGGDDRLSKIRGSGGKKKKRVRFVDQAAAKGVDLQELLGQEKEKEVKGFDHVGGFEGSDQPKEEEEEEERVLRDVVEGGGDEGMLSDEEEWEGIERSELEKEFGKAREFVEGGEKQGRFGMVGNDVMMELYGLQKVAMEGPCHEPQPMALKLTARAKWNAWQRLGNMSPEEAMERYVTLLSNIVPGWMDNCSSVETEKSSNEEISSSSDTNPNADVTHQSSSASERITESSSLTSVSTSVNEEKE